MTDLGADPNAHALHYFELDESQARVFLGED